MKAEISRSEIKVKNVKLTLIGYVSTELPEIVVD